MVLLQFSWRRGSKDSRGQGFQCLFYRDFINAFNFLSISATSFFAVPNSPFSTKLKSPCREPLSRTAANNILVSSSQTKTIRNVKHPNVINGCLSSISFCNIRKNRHKRSSYLWRPYFSSFGNFAVILYIFKQSSYDFCQTFNSLQFFSIFIRLFYGISLEPLNPWLLEPSETTPTHLKIIHLAWLN